MKIGAASSAFGIQHCKLSKRHFVIKQSYQAGVKEDTLQARSKQTAAAQSSWRLNFPAKQQCELTCVAMTKIVAIFKLANLTLL